MNGLDLSISQRLLDGLAAVIERGQLRVSPGAWLRAMAKKAADGAYESAVQSSEETANQSRSQAASAPRSTKFEATPTGNAAIKEILTMLNLPSKGAPNVEAQSKKQATG